MEEWWKRGKKATLQGCWRVAEGIGYGGSTTMNLGREGWWVLSSECYTAHVGFCIAMDIATFDIAHIGVDIAVNTACNTNITHVGFDTTALSVDGNGLAGVNIEVVYISFYVDGYVDLFAVFLYF